jgi:hypothetical protein
MIKMAKMVKGTKRYVLVRGKDENGDDIIIDMFAKKELDAALRESRIGEKDNVWKVEVLGSAELKKSPRSKKASRP